MTEDGSGMVLIPPNLTLILMDISTGEIDVLDWWTDFKLTFA